MKAISSSRQLLTLLAMFMAMHSACSILVESELEDKPVSTTGGTAGRGGTGGTGGMDTGGGGSSTSISSSSGNVTLCDGVPCIATDTCCSGACVNLDESTDHCGSCGTACSPGLKCCVGTCAACCADTECPEDHVCLDGTCTLKCGANETECGVVCADLQNSTPHCGSCDIDCLSGHKCEAGVCLPGWASMSTINALAPRQRAAAVWTGSALFVWGGANEQGVLGDGGLYDPKTDTWTTINPVDAPEARVDAIAILIGNRVMVWGGAITTDNAAPGLNSGKLYDLTTSTWSALPVSPIGRRNPVAVWTGTQVLVWGGYSGTSPFFGGAVFDPNAVPNPKWTSMNSANSPSARSGVAWAWSGQELLLFGGRPGGTGASSEGFAFNPTTNTWRSLSSSGAPSQRFDAFGGWTGTAMLVYGGRDGSNTFTDAYLMTPTPMNGTWSSLGAGPLGKRSAPWPRTGWTHTTANKIFLTGGLDETLAAKLTGQLYDCSMNAWGASIPEWKSVATHENGVSVWTGTELILWSGLDGGMLTAAGDRYRP